MTAGRFTATLRLFEIPSPEPASSGYTDRRHSAAAVAPTRPEPIEVASLTLRAESLDDLKEKVAAHAALV